MPPLIRLSGTSKVRLLNWRRQAAINAMPGIKPGQIRTPWHEFWRRFRGQPVAMGAGVFVLLLTVVITAFTAWLIYFSAWGIKVRAVVLNRQMASAVGINTAQVDSRTFALGCGIAGIAGSAFTMIGSTGPTAGQQYIVDTFLVVVFGGAQSLLGTLASAFAISQSQSTLEFFLSGSMAKVITLLIVVGILLLRPQGLFANRVRL